MNSRGAGARSRYVPSLILTQKAVRDMRSLTKSRLRRWKLILKMADERQACDGWRRLAVELAIAAIYEQEVEVDKKADEKKSCKRQGSA